MRRRARQRMGQRMRQRALLAAMIGSCILAAAGCTRNDVLLQTEPAAQVPTTQTGGVLETAETQPAASQPSASQPSGSGSQQAGEADADSALALALQNAGVPETDIYNVKVEGDRENAIPIWQVEFETDYGDYDFEIAREDGSIVGADYEVDEEWLDALGGSPVDLEGAKAIVQGKVPGSSAEDVQIWEEGGDGRGRYEGELYFNGIQYEFEIDPATGIIFDWNADLRE